MLLGGGKELLFWINSISSEKSNTYLSHIDTDSKGMKCTGGFPLLWDYEDGHVLGPTLYDDHNVYRVADVDYPNNCIWLEQI